MRRPFPIGRASWLTDAITDKPGACAPGLVVQRARLVGLMVTDPCVSHLWIPDLRVPAYETDVILVCTARRIAGYETAPS